MRYAIPNTSHIRNYYDDWDHKILVYDSEKDTIYSVVTGSGHWQSYKTDHVPLDDNLWPRVWNILRRRYFDYLLSDLVKPSPEMRAETDLQIIRGKHKGQIGRPFWIGTPQYCATWKQKHWRVGLELTSGEKVFVDLYATKKVVSTYLVARQAITVLKTDFRRICFAYA